ncbi:sugar phosphate isomerase/epimerase family protein [Microbacterium sp. CPCC 204701]|uniref:sugar phosphate isomerase/epimerase family protein n=1 Tax=Microbacterium sp. CPCC 204701 TaxID=2493084 RepID=UPI00197C89D9|nr:sugar phosphate isomerase/epimerase family protein [Microbacterium sp. CPCC 204701]
MPLRPGLSEVSPFPLYDRIEAASAAGFVGMGFSFQDLEASLERYGLKNIAERLDASGIVDVEVEMLGDWFADGDARIESDRVRDVLLDAAEAFGARHLKCGGPPHPVDDAQLAERFAELCDVAAATGLNVAIEPMPFTTVATPADGLALVNAAGRANGGLCIDIWHVARSGTPYGDVARLPADRVFAVELNDAARDPVGDLLDDTLDRRLPCGQGDLDVRAFVEAVRRAGFQGPFGVEIISSAHRTLPLDEAARLAFETTAHVIRKSNGE